MNDSVDPEAREIGRRAEYKADEAIRLIAHHERNCERKWTDMMDYMKTISRRIWWLITWLLVTAASIIAKLVFLPG